jgi:hypothetical protein
MVFNATFNNIFSYILAVSFIMEYVIWIGWLFDFNICQPSVGIAD